MCAGDGEDPGMASLFPRSLLALFSFPAYHHQCCLFGHFLMRFVLWEDARTLGQAAGLREGAGATPAAELFLVVLPILHFHGLIPRTGAWDQGALLDLNPRGQTEPRSCLMWGPLCPCRAQLCAFTGFRYYSSLQRRLSRKPGAPLTRSQG